MSLILAQAQQYTGTALLLEKLGFVLCFLGLGLLFIWIFRFDGIYSLQKIPVRRHWIRLHIPFIQVGLWILLISMPGLLIHSHLEEAPQWLKSYCTYMAVAAAEVILSVAFIIQGKFAFARGLKGMGLNIKTMPRDFGWALVNYTAILPVVVVALHTVVLIGNRLAGPDFQMQINEGLTILTENENPIRRITIIFFVVIIVPVFEEILFRAFLQSAIKGYVKNPWTSILLTSVIFSLLHPWMHMPALLALSVCLGYAYEKSGSLLRPIFIHLLFNFVSVFVTIVTFTGQN